MRQLVYLREPFTSIEEVEKAIEIWDATTAYNVTVCPRKAEYKLRMGLQKKDSSPLYLLAGSSVHAALNAWYCGCSEEEVLAVLYATWGDGDSLPRPPGDPYSHISLGFLETVLRNYMEYSRKRDTFYPLVVELDDLDLEKVVAAIWSVTDSGKVVLGESKLVMEFEIEEGVKFCYAMKPDLPVVAGGQVFVLDHKTTSSYLSSYYFGQFRISNQLRGYCAGLSRLLNREVNGAIINGLYLGPKAVDSTFKGSLFERYGPFIFTRKHQEEAIRNQYHWRKVLDYYESVGYYPQAVGKHCSSCEFLELCRANPLVRESVIAQDYIQGNEVKFFDL